MLLKTHHPELILMVARSLRWWLWGQFLIHSLLLCCLRGSGRWSSYSHCLYYFRLAGEVKKNKSALTTNTCTVSKALTFTITNSSIPVHALVLGTCRCLFKHCSSVCYNVTRQSCIHFDCLEIFFSSHRCGLGVSWTRQDWHRELCGCT